MDDSIKEFAKDYWELGAIAITAGAVSIYPTLQPIFDGICFGIAGYYAGAINKTKGSDNLETHFKMIRDITFYMGASAILDKNINYMANLPEIGKISLPLTLLTSSAILDMVRLKRKNKTESSKNLEDKIK